jgi:hypothetical protein
MSLPGTSPAFGSSGSRFLANLTLKCSWPAVQVELAINLQAAKAIGIAVPSSVLARRAEMVTNLTQLTLPRR